MTKRIEDILEGITYQLIQGDLSVEIDHLQLDSRKVEEKGLFIAVKGSEADGHQFIPKAITQGAVAVVCEDLPEDLIEGVTYIQIEHTGKAAGHLASAFYDHPSRKLKLVGITGTNGKTTTVMLLHQLFRKMGYNAGVLSTIENKINETIIPTKLTTPDAVTINALMAEMVKANCTHCFMEASSHAIVQERIAGLSFDVAIFSNISHDHLDYHGTFPEYIKAKKKLFDQLPASAHALVNADDRRGAIMLQNCKAKHHTFALKSMADFKGKLVDNTFEGLLMEIDQKEVWFQLIGDFNAYNLLGVYGAAVLLGEPSDEVLTVLSEIRSADGRFEQIISPENVRAIVDYAHTPDALENVLKTIQQLRIEGERIITVVGCGGNRDKTKRPVMAKTATTYSDLVVLTSDNPRFEDPEEILNDMMEGITPVTERKVSKVVDRKEAIKIACQMAQPNDVILVAGKGHETYQEIKGERYPFDDREILKLALKK
ncbi:UDP-N-acetylmuramoyl-L-alanyl-D-glutamate--2,6-diaminopimelate ligase [Algivirga pacifica]|uniref:UDP-N-acetylmuramoyl-L-alanyl-D-glutamate--2,6-diaminopimelate ligase n=1 Tax=Algivirga pacifica TaxID=1162670 RepID=A0ABP9D0F4_9BACT